MLYYIFLLICQVFCSACWTVHVDEIKNHFDKIVELLETTSSRFDNSIDEFRVRINGLKSLGTFF